MSDPFERMEQQFEETFVKSNPIKETSKSKQINIDVEKLDCELFKEQVKELIKNKEQERN